MFTKQQVYIYKHSLLFLNNKTKPSEEDVGLTRSESSFSDTNVKDNTGIKSAVWPYDASSLKQYRKRKICGNKHISAIIQGHQAVFYQLFLFYFSTVCYQASAKLLMKQIIEIRLKWVLQHIELPWYKGLVHFHLLWALSGVALSFSDTCNVMKRCVHTCVY